MDKQAYFLAALQHGAGKSQDWVLRVFSQVQTSPPAPYPYLPTQVDGKPEWYFHDPAKDLQLTVIEQSDASLPLARFREPFSLAPGALENYQGEEPLLTTYGNVLVNYLLLVLPFGAEIPFQTGVFDLNKVESLIEQKLIDDPEPDDGGPPPPGKIYVRQYLQFADNALPLVAYAPLAVVSVTPKSLTGHPQARELRAQLMEQYRDQLHDPAVVAKLGKAFEKLDRAWLADDPASEYYSVKASKYFGGVRNKLYYHFGGESAFSEGTSVEYIANSLQEGIDLNHLPAMANSIRAGSYNRGAQTKLGGESTKTIYRMLGSIRIAEADCGTSLGIPTRLTEDNIKHYLDYWIIDRGNSVLLTATTAPQYLNKDVLVRSPMTCKTEGRNTCARCMGEAMAQQPDAIAVAGAEVGGRFLTSFLKKMHASGNKTAKWDYQERLL